MQKRATLTLKTVLCLGLVALCGCEALPQASIAPKAEVPAAPTYTPAQRAWLNFVAKVRRGEQLDPTGQYMKDGTIVPANQQPRTRPKFDAARDRYPFRLLPDGTIVLLPEATKNNTGSKEAPPQPPIEDCPGGCPGVPITITSTFVSSVGMGGTGDILDIKVRYDGTSTGPYERLIADLNSGTGGIGIYYDFVRAIVLVGKGTEYTDDPTLNVADPIVAYDSKTKDWFYQSVPDPEQDFYHIWYRYGYYATEWPKIDLNEGAGGKYIYSYQAKKLSARSNASPFHEVGVLLGNSATILPPVGWQKWPQDLNEGAGGDFIYFCYKQ